MMSKKRLTYAILINNYYQIREVDDDGYCRRLAPTGIIDLLNEQDEKIKKLEKENKQLRKTIALFEVEEDEINFLKEIVVIDDSLNCHNCDLLDRKSVSKHGFLYCCEDNIALTTKELQKNCPKMR